MLPPQLLFLAQILTKSFVGWGFAPKPHWGAYSAYPDSLACLVEMLREEEGQEKGGKGEEEEGEERGKGKGVRILPFLPYPVVPTSLIM